MVENKIFLKLRMFSDQSCVNRTETVHGTLHFLFLLSPVVWKMCEKLHYESVYSKELHNGQEYYWPTMYRAGAAVVSTINIGVTFLSWECQGFLYGSDNIRRSPETVNRYSKEFHLIWTQEHEESHDLFSSDFPY